MIQFENATRTYGNKVAVSDLSLTIPSGELFALLGPNGAGQNNNDQDAGWLAPPFSWSYSCLRS